MDLAQLPTIIASVTAIATALGVWLGPWYVERQRRRREIGGRIRQRILELESFSQVNEEEIEKDWIALGKDVIKPLKSELEKAEHERTRKVIRRVLYRLGDEETMKATACEYRDVLERSKDLNEVERVLEEIKRLKMKELAPCVFDRLQREKGEIRYEMIVTIGTLGYKPALPYLMDLATKHLKEGKPDDSILHACIPAIGDIASKTQLTNEEFRQVMDVFKNCLQIEDEWLVDAVVRCELRQILNLKLDLPEPLKEELIKKLAGLLEHKKDSIRIEAVRRLRQLGDRRAVPHLKKVLNQGECSTSLKAELEEALEALE